MLDATGLALSARDGLADTRAFIATRFDLADEYEADGNTEAADAMRATWQDVLTRLDTVDRAVDAELGSTTLAPA